MYFLALIWKLTKIYLKFWNVLRDWHYDQMKEYKVKECTFDHDKISYIYLDQVHLYLFIKSHWFANKILLYLLITTFIFLNQVLLYFSSNPFFICGQWRLWPQPRSRRRLCLHLLARGQCLIYNFFSMMMTRRRKIMVMVMVMPEMYHLHHHHHDNWPNYAPPRLLQSLESFN